MPPATVPSDLTGSTLFESFLLVSPFYPVGARRSKEACRNLYLVLEHQLPALTGSTECFLDHSAALHCDGFTVFTAVIQL